MNNLDDYQDQVFEGIKLERESLCGRKYYDCTFKRCSFVNVDFSQCSFESCQFISSSVVASKMDNARFLDVSFKDCKMVGIIFSVLSDFAVSFSLEQTVLLSCTFSDMRIAKTRFESCQINDCLFANCDLRQSNFSASSFQSGQITNCDLRECNFLGAEGFMINPGENKMRNALFGVDNAIELLRCYGLKYK